MKALAVGTPRVDELRELGDWVRLRPEMTADRPKSTADSPSVRPRNSSRPAQQRGAPLLADARARVVEGQEGGRAAERGGHAVVEEAIGLVVAGIRVWVWTSTQPGSTSRSRRVEDRGAPAGCRARSRLPLPRCGRRRMATSARNERSAVTPCRRARSDRSWATRPSRGQLPRSRWAGRPPTGPAADFAQPIAPALVRHQRGEVVAGQRPNLRGEAARLRTGRGSRTPRYRRCR